jgi:hypothetical protein
MIATKVVLAIAFFAFSANSRRVQSELNPSLSLQTRVATVPHQLTPKSRNKNIAMEETKTDDGSVAEDSIESGPEGKGTPFTQEEIDALYQASISKDTAVTPAEADKYPTKYAPLLKQFNQQPQIYFSLLRNPSQDPPEQVWDPIREKWSILKERSNAELVEALKPIKAKFVDVRYL